MTSTPRHCACICAQCRKRLKDSDHCSSSCRNRSTTHFHHDEKKSTTDPYYENLLKTVTKTKTMGAPRKPGPLQATLPHRAASAHTQSLSATRGNFAENNGENANGKRPTGGSAAYLPVENFKSKVPMKWAVGSGKMTSSYMVRRFVLKQIMTPAPLGFFKRIA